MPILTYGEQPGGATGNGPYLRYEPAGHWQAGQRPLPQRVQGDSQTRHRPDREYGQGRRVKVGLEKTIFC